MSHNPQIFVVEDDNSFAEFLKIILEEEEYRVKVFNNPEEALREIQVYSPSLIITDLKMPSMDGITFIEKAKELKPKSAFIVITAFGTIPSAVEAMKKGAIDYVTKPLSSPEDFINLINRTINSLEIKKIQTDLREESYSKIPYDILFAGIDNIYEEIKKVAKTDSTLILYGETGTGKSAIAKAIHEMSSKIGPFVEINCAAIPESLIESELFGYEKGAFSGAFKQKKGKIELAQNGTLFLDEIGELSLHIQAKFLKVLQDKSFERLGGLETIKTNARFITATNKNLRQMVIDGKFREDLYFRLNVFPINIPPLRERREFILKIADFLIKKISTKIGNEPQKLSQSAIKFLRTYNFPGNIRELENILERSIILSKGKEIEINHNGQIQIPDNVISSDIKSLEKKAIIEALQKSQGNKKEASNLLGISLRKLYYKIKEYGLE